MSLFHFPCGCSVQRKRPERLAQMCARHLAEFTLHIARAKKRGAEPWALDPRELDAVARAFFERLDGDAQARIAKVWNVAPVKSKNGYGKVIELPLKHPNEAAALILDCVYAMDLHVPSWSKEPPKRLLEACKRYGVDAEKIKRDLATADNAKPKAKKPASVKKK